MLKWKNENLNIDLIVVACSQTKISFKLEESAHASYGVQHEDHFTI